MVPSPPTKLHHMRSPKHLLLATITVSAAVSLAACTPSPDPDETLIQLHQDALHDSQALLESAPEVAALRLEHAGEITEEIQRLCGFTDEGDLPESCTFTVPDIATTPENNPDFQISDSQVRMLNRLDETPPESIPLITEQYIEQARLGPVVGGIDVLDGVILEAEDLIAAQELLAEEYAAAWALGVALAYVSPELEDAAQNAIDRHREYAALLRTTIDPVADTSPSEPGYNLTELTDPVDAASAATMIAEVQSHAITSWHNAATRATDPGWRSLSTQIAGATAKDTVPFN